MTACFQKTGTAPRHLILRRLRFHVIDDEDGIGMLAHLEFQAESIDAFKQTKAAIGIGSAYACRRLTPLAAVEVGAGRPGQGEVPASFHSGDVDRGMIHVGGRHRGQFVGELGECGVLAGERRGREPGRVIGNGSFARGPAVGICLFEPGIALLESQGVYVDGLIFNVVFDFEPVDQHRPQHGENRIRVDVRTGQSNVRRRFRNDIVVIGVQEFRP
jgi:hypothetical protein